MTRAEFDSLSLADIFGLIDECRRNANELQVSAARHAADFARVHGATSITEYRYLPFGDLDGALEAEEKRKRTYAESMAKARARVAQFKLQQVA